VRPPTAPGEWSGKSEGKNMAEQSHRDDLLTPAEVAALFRVNPKTVTRWARAGKITAIRTLGGHRRFRSSEIKRCLEQMEHESA
jgi:excisionase family DNA binding protein